jgi:hypothetical protein
VVPSTSASKAVVPSTPAKKAVATKAQQPPAKQAPAADQNPASPTAEA